MKNNQNKQSLLKNNQILFAALALIFLLFIIYRFPNNNNNTVNTPSVKQNIPIQQPVVRDPAADIVEDRKTQILDEIQKDNIQKSAQIEELQKQLADLKTSIANTPIPQPVVINTPAQNTPTPQIIEQVEEDNNDNVDKEPAVNNDDSDNSSEEEENEKPSLAPKSLREQLSDPIWGYYQSIELNNYEEAFKHISQQRKDEKYGNNLSTFKNEAGSFKNADITYIDTTSRIVWMTRDKIDNDGSTSKKTIGWGLVKEGDFYKMHRLLDSSNRYGY